MDYVQITKNRPQHVAGFAICSAGTVPSPGQSCPGMDICDHPLFLFQSFHHSRRIFNCSSGLKDRLSHRSDFIHPWLPIKSNTFDLLPPIIPVNNKEISQSNTPISCHQRRSRKTTFFSGFIDPVFVPNSNYRMHVKCITALQ